MTMLMQVQIFVRKVRNKAAGTIGKLLPKSELLCHLPCDVLWCRCAMPGHAMLWFWFGHMERPCRLPAALCYAVVCCAVLLHGARQSWRQCYMSCMNKQQCTAACPTAELSVLKARDYIVIQD